MNRSRWIWIFVLAPALSAGQAHAEAGRTGGAVLTRTQGARSAALGQALTADAGDLDDMSFNAAGLARLSMPALSATYERGLADDNFGFANYGHATHYGAWFVGASGLDAGTIDINQSDGTQGTRHAQQDFLGTAGLAIGRRSSLSVGFSGKFLRSQLAEEATATTVAGDAGILWHTPLAGVQIAAAIQNVGSGLKYEIDRDPLPQTSRIGASYILDLHPSTRVPEALRLRYSLLVDSIKPRNENSSLNAGLEIRRNFGRINVPNWAALRGGYIGATKSATMGIGFQISGVSIDYAFQLVNDLNNTHRVTLGYHFYPDPTVVRDRRPGMSSLDQQKP